MNRSTKAIATGFWLLALTILVKQLLLLSPPVHAAGPWYVGPGGGDGNGCTSPATRCATINGALNKPGFVAGDTIRVAIGLYTGAGNEVVLLDKNATLAGGWNAGFTTQSGVSTIDGQGARRGIKVNTGVIALIERFVIQKGFASGGGGIFSEGVITLTNSLVNNNTADFGSEGGGIVNLSTLTLINSTVSNNKSIFVGTTAGIYNSGALTLTNSTVSGNEGSKTILNYGTSILNYSVVNNNLSVGIENEINSTLILNNSTIRDNTSSGILSEGVLTLNNSTVSRNIGLGILKEDGTATLNNSTVSENGADGLGLSGGGILNFSGGPFILKNSIIAGNQSSNGPNCSGAPISSLGYNLLGAMDGCTFTPTTGDLTNIDPKLGPLEGSPGYHPLLAGSPAINAGNPAGCTNHQGQLLTTDQRGQPRFGRCDRGSYEAQPIAFFNKTVSPTTVVPGDRVTYTLAFQNGGITPLAGIQVTDPLPPLFTYVDNSLSATSGSYGYQNGVITWTGSVNAGSSINITFGARVSPTFGIIANTAVISGGGELITRTALVTVDGSLCNLTKHGSNPVLSVGANGSWDDVEVWEPTVLKDGSLYKMWYFGFDGATSRIGYATSPNGVTWTKHPGNPVLSPSQSWEGSRVINPSVIKDGNLYKLWYTGIDINGVSRIGYATSPNGITWTKHPNNPVLEIGPAGSWEDADVSSPTVLKLGNLYHLWYEGNDGATTRIGHATSLDGLTWTKDPANPVLDIGPSGEWDWLNSYGPSVISYNNTFLMWYSGNTLPSIWQTGYALSTDGSTWSRQEKLLSPGGSGAFDDRAADHPTVLVEGNQFKIWYSGFKEGSKYTIGYATAQVCGVAAGPLTESVYLPIVMKGSAACPAYYSDSFADPDSGWPIGDNNSRKFGYTGGEYQIWLKSPNRGLSVTPGAKATDFTASISARRISADNGGYGIIFGINEDWSQWYEFDIGPQGYSIWQYLGNNNYNILRNWTPSSHIKTGATWNRLKVIRSGANISVYVNNQHLATVTNNDYTGLRRIGLTEFSGNSGIDVRFDDFSLYPASCGVQAAGTDFEMGKPEIHEAPVPPGLE